eukprot:6473908-Amphidinium_carterae.2
MQQLPSGHLTVSVTEFGAKGWQAPAECEPLSQQSRAEPNGCGGMYHTTLYRDGEFFGEDSRDSLVGDASLTGFQDRTAHVLNPGSERTSCESACDGERFLPQAPAIIVEDSDEHSHAGTSEKLSEDRSEEDDYVVAGQAIGGCLQNDVLSCTPPEVETLLAHSIPLCPHRTNLQVAESVCEHQVRSQAFGGYTGRGVGICLSTLQHPQITQAIHRLAKKTQRKGKQKRLLGCRSHREQDVTLAC